MRLGVLGTGIVGRTVGSRLVDVGHQVTMGSRTAGGEAAVEWARGAGEHASEGTFADAARFAEVVVNATNGAHSLDALQAAGEENLTGKVIIDIANPLDFSHGFPPSLSVCNTDSLAEQIQRTFPDARVVKTLSTISASVMVNPGLAPGSALFLSGNDDAAKSETRAILTSFGWPHGDIVDLGDITTARAVEMYLPLWLRLMRTLGTPSFNIAIARQALS
ncbi:MAG: NADPH-dependent F420 reductase [Candidatus Dormibacteria bacterium]